MQLHAFVSGQNTIMLQTQAHGQGHPVLVFIHGFSCDLSDWKDVVPLLSVSHRCLTVDLPGHGHSPAARPLSVESCAMALNETLDEMGLDDVVLIGHSMGCRVACEAASRSGGRVRGIVCIDGSRVNGAGALEKLERRLAPAGAMAQFLPGFYEDFYIDATPPAVRAFINARRDRMDHELARELLLNFIRWDAAAAVAALARIRAPLLVIQSTALDANMKRVPIPPGTETPWMAAVRAGVPGARFEIMQGVGHFPMLEAPAATAKLIAAFLNTAG